LAIGRLEAQPKTATVSTNPQADNFNSVSIAWSRLTVASASILNYFTISKFDIDTIGDYNRYSRAFWLFGGLASPA
jgi:hypothetical protein